MKRFAIAAALAVVLGLGFAGKADAQYYYRNTAITPGGGLVTTNQVFVPGAGFQTRNVFVAPNGAVRRQYITGDPFGNTYFSNGFNPNTGFMYNRGFYQPNPFVYPYYGGYGYGFYRW